MPTPPLPRGRPAQCRGFGLAGAIGADLVLLSVVEYPCDWEDRANGLGQSYGSHVGALLEPMPAEHRPAATPMSCCARPPAVARPSCGRCSVHRVRRNGLWLPRSAGWLRLRPSALSGSPSSPPEGQSRYLPTRHPD